MLVRISGGFVWVVICIKKSSAFNESWNHPLEEDF